MKALVYTGEKTLEFQDMPDPQMGENECLIEIQASGICGSDMHAYLGHDTRRPAPLILGHEAAGVVIDTNYADNDSGNNPPQKNPQKNPKKNQRVTINPLVSCQTCRACRQGRENLCPDRQIISMPPREGAFAQYVRMPATNLIAVPDHVSSVDAALCEPLAVSWHAVKLALAAVYTPAADVSALIIGGGAIGVAAARCLNAFNTCDVTIIEPHAARRDFLQTHCHDKTIDAHTGQRYDLVIDAVGNRASRQTACLSVLPGGVIAHIGLGEATGGLDVRYMTLQEITFIGTYTYTQRDFTDTAHALFDGKLGSFDWVQTRPLSEGAHAFSQLYAGQIAAPKTILIP